MRTAARQKSPSSANLRHNHHPLNHKYHCGIIFCIYFFFSKEGGRGIKSASYTWYLSLATPGLHVSLEVLTHIAVLSRVYCADSKRSVTSLSASQQLCKIVFFVCFFVSIHYLRRLPCNAKLRCTHATPVPSTRNITGVYM